MKSKLIITLVFDLIYHISIIIFDWKYFKIRHKLTQSKFNCYHIVYSIYNMICISDSWLFHCTFLADHRCHINYHLNISFWELENIIFRLNFSVILFIKWHRLLFLSLHFIKHTLTFNLWSLYMYTNFISSCLQKEVSFRVRQ